MAARKARRHGGASSLADVRAPHEICDVFIGHFGVAFAAKRAAPRASLGTTFVAAQLADLIWPILLLAGVEQVRIAPAAENPFLNLEFLSYPWSHSLATEIAGGMVLGLLAYVASRDARSAIVVGALVPSHWLLDWVVHVPDLPVFPGTAGRFGLGLWHSPAITVALELIVFAGGVAVYANSTRARDRIGRVGLWGLVLLLMAFYAASIVSPPPPTVTALATGALIGWPLTLLPWWIDRHRSATVDPAISY